MNTKVPKLATLSDRNTELETYNFFLNHLAPSSKGEPIPKAPYFLFFWLRVHVISLNLIAFMIGIETEPSLLALAKCIY